MKLAPIVLFAYNRPWHTQQTLEALTANYLADQSDLIVFADGPKPNASEKDLAKIQEVRDLVNQKKWCKSVQLIENGINKGLAQSIIAGVTEIINQYGTIIVLEDDLVTSPWFLTYVNEGLEMYKNVQNVYSVNGYMFPIETDRTDTVLLPYTSTWGWGTWKDKWHCFDFEMKGKESILKSAFLRARFNLADYDYSSMLNYGNNSWGIRWYYSVFVRNGFGLFPTKTLVQNIGFDGSGVNCIDESSFQLVSIRRVKINFVLDVDLFFYSKYLTHFTMDKRNYKSSSYNLGFFFKRVLKHFSVIK
jgi:hypothetical protein